MGAGAAPSTGAGCAGVRIGAFGGCGAVAGAAAGVDAGASGAGAAAGGAAGAALVEGAATAVGLG